MEDLKVKFCLSSEAWENKTTVNVKTIQILGQEEIFSFPIENQPIQKHIELAKLSIIKGAVKSLNTRGKFRNITITLKKELQSSYLDEEGNVVFCGYYLEAIDFSPQRTSNTPLPNIENPIRSISNNMMLEKFSSKNQNAKSWLNLFMFECDRLKISEEQFPEALKINLEGPALDWFSSLYKTCSMDKPWDYWKISFLNTFGEKSWSEIEYAYSFRWLSGPLLDFALKKINLLIDVDPDLSISSQINFIILALPKFVRSRLNKKELVTIEHLMSTLRQLDPISNNSTHTNKYEFEINKQKRNFVPCQICEKAGYANRFHSETICRNKVRPANVRFSESKN